MVEVNIIIAIGLAVVALFLIIQVTRIIRIRTLHATLRKSVEAGQVLTPELVKSFDRTPEPGVADQRTGLVLIASGLAVIVAGAISGSNDLRDLVAVSMLPIFTGAALLLRVRLSTARRVGS